MKFKLDENLGRRFGEPLRLTGHDVATVADQGMPGAADASLIEVCRAEGRCLVTLDLEFGNPLIYPPSEYCGIVVLRVPGRIRPADLMTALRTLAQGLGDRPLHGRLWVVQAGRIREYRPESDTEDPREPSSE